MEEGPKKPEINPENTIRDWMQNIYNGNIKKMFEDASSAENLFSDLNNIKVLKEILLQMDSPLRQEIINAMREADRYTFSNISSDENVATALINRLLLSITLKQPPNQN
jgi:hypothetical protein